MDIVGHIIVQVWKCNPVFCTNWLTDYNLVDVTELIPVFIPITQSCSQSFFIIKEPICNVLNTIPNTYAGSESLIRGSNLGPLGMAIFKAFAVKNDLWSKRLKKSVRSWLASQYKVAIWGRDKFQRLYTEPFTYLKQSNVWNCNWDYDT